MKEFEQKISDALYTACVADEEKIRSDVLAQAHRQAERRRAIRRSWLAVPAAACLTFFVLVNSSAAVASAVYKIPVLGPVARVVTFRQWDDAGDAFTAHTEQPAVDGTGNADFEATVNRMIEDQITQLNERAQQEAAEYKENWLAMGNQEADFVPIRYTFDYETYYTSAETLSFLIRQRETYTTDSVDTHTTLYYYNLDVASGESLSLQELLGEDWKSVVSAAIDAQIRSEGDARKVAYYQEFWVDKNVPLDDTQKFYLNRDGAVVIVFDEGWIAPYEDGPQTFVIGYTDIR